MVYEQFGNIEPIRKNYAAIKKWMHHIRSEFTTEDGVINADKYGDWCMPPESPELIHSQDPARKTDGALIATAYYYKVSQMLAKFARLKNISRDKISRSALSSSDFPSSLYFLNFHPGCEAAGIVPSEDAAPETQLTHMFFHPVSMPGFAPEGSSGRQ